MTADLSFWNAPMIIAHRGSRTLWPENTMLAFREALALRARYLETDLQATSDDVLVCHHDRSVVRTTDGVGDVADYTLERLSRLDAAYRHRVDGSFPFRGEDLRVPTLRQVLTEFPEVGFVVDLKSDDMEVLLVDLLDELDAFERVIVGSFSDRRLVRFRQLAGPRALTSGGPREIVRWRFGGGASVPDPQVLQVPVGRRGLTVVTPAFIRSAHSRGRQVHVWTINRPVEMRRLLDMGVDGLITDRPDLGMEVVGENG
ncbi:MAG: glycerophosphodiester phosphodiesterase [Acidimicrobiia bacterium]|nr:glycerophosphodiester phosphodiesterase [Acidimicrobiia bacterium]